MFCCFGSPKPKSKPASKRKSKHKSKSASKPKSASNPKSASKPRNKSVVGSKNKSGNRNKDKTPKPKDKIPKAVREAVWEKYHGTKSTGVCYSCGERIQRYNKGWHCSHVLADAKGGEETVENLRTCCPHCNLSMGDQNLYVYMKAHNMKGPGKTNVNKYLKKHPSQHLDTRTNNWQ